MDLPVIGAHCEEEHCHQLDLLPLRCPGCSQVFCRHHIALESHSCSSLSRTNHGIDASKVSTISSKRTHCDFEGCRTPTLESVIIDKTEPEHRVVATCPHCSGAFCAAHRHPPDHSCAKVPSASSPTLKNPEAHELLSKHFPAASISNVASASSSKRPKPPTDPKKLARLRAVELMKMRHHAIPLDRKDKTASVPPTQRIHVKVVSSGTTDQIFWLRKNVVTGRALDLIANQLSVHISDRASAYLDKLPSDIGSPTRLQNDKLLSEQINDGETLVLSIGNSDMVLRDGTHG